LSHCDRDYYKYKTSVADAGDECDASCVTYGELHCWGAGPDMCQTREILLSRYHSKNDSLSKHIL